MTYFSKVFAVDFICTIFLIFCYIFFGKFWYIIFIISGLFYHVSLDVEICEKEILNYFGQVKTQYIEKFKKKYINIQALSICLIVYCFVMYFYENNTIKEIFSFVCCCVSIIFCYYAYKKEKMLDNA